jgi:pyrimidine-nucleoside phosphorylase
MRAVDIIRKKRDGAHLTKEEIHTLIRAYMKGNVADYQMSAFLMAVFFRGMNFQETRTYTEELMGSGEVLDLSGLKGPRIDKHSTGGVGDKISLVLAPLLAAAGATVPMISGRALGHTGGTLDKLDSIPGYRTNLKVKKFIGVLKDVGASIIGQTEQLAPADGKIYALRDVTATVSCIPLISASIMSKKLAEGIDGLVLDVKTGTGAFMSQYEDARRLAQTMVSIGRAMGKRVRAVISNMDEPLGEAVGNALEVFESVQVLKGEGPRDVRDLTLILGAHMMGIGGLEENFRKARKKLEGLLDDGSALDRWRRMVRAHGGDSKAIERTKFIEARHVETLEATDSGYLGGIDALQVGIAASLIGAGRERMRDKIDYKAGFVFKKKVGQKVERGEPLVELLAEDPSKLERSKEVLSDAIGISKIKVQPRPLVFEVIE